jgi:hypothetical protein
MQLKNIIEFIPYIQIMCYLQKKDDMFPDKGKTNKKMQR